MPPHRSRQFIKHGTMPQLAVFEAIVRAGKFHPRRAGVAHGAPTVSGWSANSRIQRACQYSRRSWRQVEPPPPVKLYASADAVLETLERAGASRGTGRHDTDGANHGDAVFTDDTEPEDPR